ncbi:MAG: 8-amino-7-oxononanoate synthase [Limnobacter sp.]|nr:8-amino-7-oxononanoate synthase [Limnobacter sp.]
MNLNQRCESELAELDKVGLKRVLPRQATAQSSVEAPQLLDFSSNDYLQLSRHPAVLAAGIACAQEHGAGATGSRLLSGNLPCFEALENQVAEFKRSQAALVFATGYQANAGALSTLLDKQLWGEEPVVLTDRLNHASLHHACKLAGVKQVRFRHNDLAHLEELLNKHPKQQKIIATESVFGMDGDQLPVLALADLALQHQALVYIDEAHATGVWGPEGRGLGALTSPAIEALKALGLWVVMGTFSKAVGVSGAYIACSHAVKLYLVNRCTGFVYSTAPSPFTVGAVSEALRLIPSLTAERKHLHDLSDQFRSMLAESGWNCGTSSTHIVPVIAGEADDSIRLKQHLLQQGLITSAVRPPTVPPHTARVRIALNCGHQLKDLERLIQALESTRA